MIIEFNLDFNMRFDIITLFSDLFEPFFKNGITRRAFEQKHMLVQCWNPRDFAKGAYRRVDDRPFGGGAGMVLMPEPLENCLLEIWKSRAETQKAPVIFFSPIGQTMNHSVVAHWANAKSPLNNKNEHSGAILLCGRYEGVDQRFVDAYVSYQLSLGDFVLSGGEIAAIAFLDAIARLQPDVLNQADSYCFDSFNPMIDGLLDHPHYTRPEKWRPSATIFEDSDQQTNIETMDVPDVLLSGHHKQIKEWRREQSLRLTQKNRPELIQSARKAHSLSALDEKILRSINDNNQA